jgi:hypothetical protein
LYALGRLDEAEAERARLEERSRGRYVSPALRGWADLVMGIDRYRDDPTRVHPEQGGAGTVEVEPDPPSRSCGEGAAS